METTIMVLSRVWGLAIYRGYIGILGKNMENYYLGFRVIVFCEVDRIWGILLRPYRDNGKRKWKLLLRFWLLCSL